jgi:hypothetical protein
MGSKSISDILIDTIRTSIVFLVELYITPVAEGQELLIPKDFTQVVFWKQFTVLFYLYHSDQIDIVVPDFDVYCKIDSEYVWLLKPNFSQVTHNRKRDYKPLELKPLRAYLSHR